MNVQPNLPEGTWQTQKQIFLILMLRLIVKN